MTEKYILQTTDQFYELIDRFQSILISILSVYKPFALLDQRLSLILLRLKNIIKSVHGNFYDLISILWSWKVLWWWWNLTISSNQYNENGNAGSLQIFITSSPCLFCFSHSNPSPVCPLLIPRLGLQSPASHLTDHLQSNDISLVWPGWGVECGRVEDMDWTYAVYYTAWEL